MTAATSIAPKPNSKIWLEDKRPKRGAWAPGSYHCKCLECGDEFVGDKRALNCADCAYKHCYMHQKEDGRWGCLKCDVSWDQAPAECETVRLQNARYKSPCPAPTAFEMEILEHIAEECSEVIQRVTKMMRFGVKETQRGQDLDNAARLSMELGNLEKVVQLGRRLGLVDPFWEQRGVVEKERKLPRYLQNEPPEGFEL